MTTAILGSTGAGTPGARRRLRQERRGDGGVKGSTGLDTKRELAAVFPLDSGNRAPDRCRLTAVSDRMFGADGTLKSEKEHERSGWAGIAARCPRHALRFARGSVSGSEAPKGRGDHRSCDPDLQVSFGGYVVLGVPAIAVARAMRTAGGRVLVRGTHGYGEAYLDA